MGGAGGIIVVGLAIMAGSTAKELAAQTEPTKRPASSLTTQADFAAYARRNFYKAQAIHNKQGHDPTNSWEFARACFDLAEFSTSNSERAEIAEQGIKASREALAANPESAPAHYYLGMNLGELAQTKGLGALSLVGEMEREFLAAQRLDEKFDHAGPNRNLGLLYRDAPSWASVGNKTKARRFLQAATDLAPDYPENRLNEVETFLKWADRNSARRELKKLEEILPKARDDLAGDAWAAAWADWDKRIATAKKKLEDGSKTIESPHSKAASAGF